MVLIYIIFLLSSLYLNGCEYEYHLNGCIYPFNIEAHVRQIPTNIECYMGVDIGGTNSDFGIFKIQENKPLLLYSLHTPTESITDFNTTMSQVISYSKIGHNITITHACIGAPGATTKEKNYSAIRGLFDIKSEELIQKYNFTCAPVVNDFFIIPYGLNHIEKDSFIPLCNVQPEDKGCRTIVGAGTGLGTAIMIWNQDLHQYIASPSEGGKIEFSPSNKTEYNLANHLKHLMGLKTIFWVHFISGKGIMRIYSMLKLSNEFKDSLFLDTHDPAIIFTHPEDELCNATIKLYFNLFARFIRNYIFTTLPYGGLYIAGGIAAKNINLFTSLFMKNYTDCQDPNLKKILNRIPIFIISDYNVSLYGAVQYLLDEMSI